MLLQRRAKAQQEIKMDQTKVRNYFQLKIQNKNLLNMKVVVHHIQVKAKSKKKKLNFDFLFIKKTKWHFRYTDSLENNLL